MTATKLLVLMGLMARSTLEAQLGAGWAGSASANGTMLFGASEQRVVGATTQISRADSTIDAALRLDYKYGEAASEDGTNFVTARSWLVGVSLDPHPFERWTPFMFATVESSLQREIDRRYSGGIGGKWTFSRGERGDASLSFAALVERTVVRQRDDGVVLTRWSARAKGKRHVDERLTLYHVTFYQPVIGDLRRYLVITTSEADYRIFEALGLNLSLIHTYDSESRGRGARSNSDGQLLAGLKATF